MKHLFHILTLAAVMLLACSAHAAERLLKDFAGKDGVTCVYVGKAMLANVNPATFGQLGASLQKSYGALLNCIEVVSINDDNAINEYRSPIEQLLNTMESNKQLSLNTETTDSSGSLVRIYSLDDPKNSEENKSIGVVNYVCSPAEHELTLVVIHFEAPTNVGLH